MIYCGDCREILKKLPTGSVNCCVTSPPYYGLRDYGSNQQIGLEDSPDEYIEKLADIFDEVKRTLRDDGTLWINIGDSYAGSSKGTAHRPVSSSVHVQNTNHGSLTIKDTNSYKGGDIKARDLIGIPWMLAFELRRRGWYLRQDIIWAKSNPMPESVKNRCTKSHEYIFLLSKAPHYYYDAESISEPVADSSVKRYAQNIASQKGSYAYGRKNGNMKAVLPRYGGKKYTDNPDVFFRTKSGSAYEFRPKRNKRDVWTVSTKPYKGSHYATFPEDLVEPCILAGCPADGTVLDPFCGTSTVGVVCIRFGREYIGIDVNEDYVRMSKERLSAVQTKLSL